MIAKQILVPDRVRRPPREGWSWIDRRFLREQAPRLSHEAIVLYFFLAAVSDKDGLSFYGDASIALRLRMVVTSHARVRYEGNRYSVPPALVGKPVTLRANASDVRIIDQGQEVTRHPRCYERGQLIVRDEDRLGALKLRRRRRASECEEE